MRAGSACTVDLDQVGWARRRLVGDESGWAEACVASSAVGFA